MKISWDHYVEAQLKWAHCLTKIATECSDLDKPVLQAHIQRAYRNAAEARASQNQR